MPEELTLDIEMMETAISELDVKKFILAAEELHYADLASVFEDLDDQERSFFTKHIPLSRFPDILAELPDSLIEETLERFDKAEQKEMHLYNV